MRKIIATLALVLGMAPPVMAGEREHMIMQNALDGYVLPKYTQLANAAIKLENAVHTLCAAPSEDQLKVTRDHFRQTAIAWSEIEWLRFGPIMRENRVERILFFPDRKGTGLRQVQAALAKQDPTVLELPSLQKKSVALQGLGALEFVLFGTGSEALAKGDDFRCHFAQTIGANLTHISSKVRAQWQSNQALRDNWTLSVQENVLFRSDKDAMNTLLSTIVHGLEAIKDTRINVFLREEPKRDRPKSAALWRSQSSLAEISGGLDGIFALYQESGFADLVVEKDPLLDDSIQFEFRQARNTANTFKGAIKELLADEKQRQRLAYLRLTIRQIVERFDTEFAPAAGLAAGFSFGDGD